MSQVYRLFFHPSPNSTKVAMFLEEATAEYELCYVNVGLGEQFNQEFISISPSSKIPVLQDLEPEFGAAPLAVFESNAILLYLAAKTNVLMPSEPSLHWEAVQWMLWQAAGQGPMCGQSAHFSMYAPENPYARSRYLNEARRLFGVLDSRLADRRFVVGDSYSIADIACYPWVDRKVRLCVGIDTLNDYPALKRWASEVGERPAVRRAYERLAAADGGRPDLAAFARNMFGYDDEDAAAVAVRARAAFARVQEAMQAPV